MAERRMFSKRIINSARFLKMPVSTQALYFHLGLHADDDGIVEAYTVMNSIGATEDDLKILVAKNFVIVLNEDLVSYITDWKENNKIRADRKIDSIYKDLLIQILPNVELQEKRQRADVAKKLLTQGKDEIGQPMDNQWTSNGQPMDSIGKDRLGKDSIGKDNIVNIATKKKQKVDAELENEFEEIWSIYPKKQGKTNALKAYIKARKNETSKEVILEGLENYITYIKANKTPTQYIKQGSTWFNQECWNDDYSIIATKQQNNNQHVNQSGGNPFFDLLREEGKM